MKRGQIIGKETRRRPADVAGAFVLAGTAAVLVLTMSSCAPEPPVRKQDTITFLSRNARGIENLHEGYIKLYKGTIKARRNDLADSMSGPEPRNPIEEENAQFRKFREWMEKRIAQARKYRDLRRELERRQREQQEFTERKESEQQQEDDKAAEEVRKQLKATR